MDVFTSVGILILSMLILAFLMLTPGVFANFFHYASGKYYRAKADRFSIFFILGAETMVVLSFFFIAIIVMIIPPPFLNLENNLTSWISTSIFVAVSLSILLFYFRKKPGSKLFISRNTAKNLLDQPKFIKTPSDAFVFGFITKIPELPFTIPIYFTSALVISNLTTSPLLYASIIILYALVSILPLFILYYAFRSHLNLASYIKLRSKNKTFLRFFLSSLYFLIAMLIITFWITNK